MNSANKTLSGLGSSLACFMVAVLFSQSILKQNYDMLFNVSLTGTSNLVTTVSFT